MEQMSLPLTDATEELVPTFPTGLHVKGSIEGFWAPGAKHLGLAGQPCAPIKARWEYIVRRGGVPIGRMEAVSPSGADLRITLSDQVIACVPPSSRAVHCWWWDGERGLLSLVMKSGWMIVYEGVDEDTAVAFYRTREPGTVYNATIRGKYRALMRARVRLIRTS